MAAIEPSRHSQAGENERGLEKDGFLNDPAHPHYHTLRGNPVFAEGHVFASEGLDDDDDELPREPKHRWCSELFGFGVRVGPFIRFEFGVGLFALLVLIVGVIVRSSCVEDAGGHATCTFLGAHIGDWLRLVSYSIGISIPGRIIDRLFFACFGVLGQHVTLALLNPLFFWVSAFEGAIARFFWIGLTWTQIDGFIQPDQKALVEASVRSLFVFQILAVLRNLALRLLLRNVLIGSFEQTISDVLFQQLVLLGLAKAHPVGPDGKLRLDKDSAYRETYRMVNATDFKRKLDFISRLRFRLYNKQGELVAIARKEAVAPFAKLAFKNLGRIPQSALVEMDLNIRDQITEGPYAGTVGAGGGGGQHTWTVQNGGSLGAFAQGLPLPPRHPGHHGRHPEHVGALEHGASADSGVSGHLQAWDIAAAAPGHRFEGSGGGAGAAAGAHVQFAGEEEQAGHSPRASMLNGTSGAGNNSARGSGAPGTATASASASAGGGRFRERAGTAFQSLLDTAKQLVGATDISTSSSLRESSGGGGGEGLRTGLSSVGRGASLRRLHSAAHARWGSTAVILGRSGGGTTTAASGGVGSLSSESAQGSFRSAPAAAAPGHPGGAAAQDPHFASELAALQATGAPGGGASRPRGPSVASAGSNASPVRVNVASPPSFSGQTAEVVPAGASSGSGAVAPSVVSAGARMGPGAAAGLPAADGRPSAGPGLPLHPLPEEPASGSQSARGSRSGSGEERQQQQRPRGSSSSQGPQSLLGGPEALPDDRTAKLRSLHERAASLLVVAAAATGRTPQLHGRAGSVFAGPSSAGTDGAGTPLSLLPGTAAAGGLAGSPPAMGGLRRQISASRLGTVPPAGQPASGSVSTSHSRYRSITAFTFVPPNAAPGASGTPAAAAAGAAAHSATASASSLPPQPSSAGTTATGTFASGTSTTWPATAAEPPSVRRVGSFGSASITPSYGSATSALGAAQPPLQCPDAPPAGAMFSAAASPREPLQAGLLGSTQPGGMAPAGGLNGFPVLPPGLPPVRAPGSGGLVPDPRDRMLSSLEMLVAATARHAASGSSGDGGGDASQQNAAPKRPHWLSLSRRSATGGGSVPPSNARAGHCVKHSLSASALDDMAARAVIEAEVAEGVAELRDTVDSTPATLDSSVSTPDLFAGSSAPGAEEGAGRGRRPVPSWLRHPEMSIGTIGRQVGALLAEALRAGIQFDGEGAADGGAGGEDEDELPSPGVVADVGGGRLGSHAAAHMHGVAPFANSAAYCASGIDHGADTRDAATELSLGARSAKPAGLFARQARTSAFGTRVPGSVAGADGQSGGTGAPVTTTARSIKRKREKEKAYPKLTISHFAAALDGRQVDVERALGLFDSNGDMLVERNEFIAAVEALWTNLRSLKASLDGQQSVSTAINLLLDSAFWAVLLACVLWIFDIPIYQVFLPLGTVLVSASFAIGSTVSNIVSSLIFVLVARPYSIGDRVTCSGVMNGEEVIIVRRIDVLYTVFLRLTNKEMIVPNHMLANMAIENHKRSPPAIFKVELHVSNQTTAAQLEQLRQRLNAYLASQPLSWKPTCMIRMASIKEQSIVLSVWLSSHYLWQDAPRLWRAIFGAYMYMLAVLREAGISFRAADQTVRVDGTLNTRMLPPLSLEQQQQQHNLHAQHSAQHGSGGFGHMPSLHKPAAGHHTGAHNGSRLQHPHPYQHGQQGSSQPYSHSHDGPAPLSPSVSWQSNLAGAAGGDRLHPSSSGPWHPAGHSPEPTASARPQSQGSGPVGHPEPGGQLPAAPVAAGAAPSPHDLAAYFASLAAMYAQSAASGAGAAQHSAPWAFAAMPPAPPPMPPAAHAQGSAQPEPAAATVSAVRGPGGF